MTLSNAFDFAPHTLSVALFIRYCVHLLMSPPIIFVSGRHTSILSYLLLVAPLLLCVFQSTIAFTTLHLPCSHGVLNPLAPRSTPLKFLAGKIWNEHTLFERMRMAPLWFISERSTEIHFLLQFSQILFWHD